MTISVLLLAGGLGLRMKSSTPKQFLLLRGKPIALYSFDLFASMEEVSEIVVVCDPAYQKLFVSPRASLRVVFSLPGQLRQDSVFNGLQEVSPNARLVCIHDSARPLITKKMVQNVLKQASEHGAAVIGMPVKFTVKESDSEGFVKRTLDRSCIWEIQTPQVISYDTLVKGFARLQQEEKTVTDDAGIAELMGHPVKLVEGAYSNIKITTPDDLVVAEQLLGAHAFVP